MDRRDRDHQWYSRFDEARMVLVIENDDGEEVEIPAVYEVCGTCDGKGSHVNPAIDAHGISPEEFDEDPGFREDYFSGVYDQPCNECHGRRVSPIVAPDAPEELRKLADSWIESKIEIQLAYEAERRMGA